MNSGSGRSAGSRRSGACGWCSIASRLVFAGFRTGVVGPALVYRRRRFPLLHGLFELEVETERAIAVVPHEVLDDPCPATERPQIADQFVAIEVRMLRRGIFFRDSPGSFRPDRPRTPRAWRRQGCPATGRILRRAGSASCGPASLLHQARSGRYCITPKLRTASNSPSATSKAFASEC